MTGRIEKLQQNYDIEIRWRAFPLHPETPEEGQLLEDLFNASPEKIAEIIAHLQQTAESLDLPFGARTKTYNTRLAQELGLWAGDQGKGELFHDAAFKAYFVDGDNLAKQSVLLSIVNKVNLPAQEAKTVLNDRSYSKNVDKDWADSRFKGITAVPSFVMGNHKLVGAQSYEALEQLINQYDVASSHHSHNDIEENKY